MYKKLKKFHIMKISDDASSKKKKRWEQSESTPDGTTKRMEVREINNGYIARLTKTNYSVEPCIDEEKEIYFKENPLKDIEPAEDTPADMMSEFFNGKISLL
jgi:hypothetical protein